MRDVKLLHPKLQGIIEQLRVDCRVAGLDIAVTDTLRTTAEQDKLYAQGRTAPGKIVTNAKGTAYSSAHQWGVAFDFCRNAKGREYDDSDGFFAKVGAIGKRLGLTWGGDFKSLIDKPHFQMTEYMPDGTTKTLRNNYTTPEKFMETWKGEDMTDAEFDKMLDAALARRAKLSPRFTGAVADEFATAVEAGITDGTRPQSFATREEVALMAYRAHLRKSDEL